MKKIDFNRDWTYRRLDSDAPFRPITLPYDCMLHEARSDDSPGGCNNGWFEGYDYEFVKEFSLSESDASAVMLEFEGIYHRSEVYLNGEKIGGRENGYLGLLLDISGKVKERNVLRVVAHGADIPNARWYTGVGIYRPVHLCVANKNFIYPNSVKITTRSVDLPEIAVEFSIAGSCKTEISVLDGDRIVAQKTVDCAGSAETTLRLQGARLWSPDSPKLYTCRLKTDGDVHEERFGIRSVSCDEKRGFLINGKRILLRGACVHHDNGLLGSVSLPEAEERKIRLLKSVGYNAIRSSHNPCSKALLDACDKLGMLVMDEYADGWYIHKTKYDYATYLKDRYRQDLKDMVDKDYNHPCVVLYSLGNEVTETAEKAGVELYRRMQDTVKKYDRTRPVTCGINIGFNQAAYAGHSFFSEEKAEKNDFKNLGTESANHRKWMFGPLFTKLNAIIPGCDKATREIFAASDVAGYNYGILRYKHDRRKYPKRVILGSETFCEDAEKFMKIAAKDNGIIGDFVWTGMDHLGEVGLGSWEYKDYAPTYIHTKGWLTSGAGRIDITGKLLPEAYYTKAAFGILNEPYIAVRPVNHIGERHSPSGWKFTNAVNSWAWTGCEGKKATVEVYACGDRVTLLRNGKKVGGKSLKKSCRAIFKVRWKEGTLTAVSYKGRKEIGRYSLDSAGTATLLKIEPEKQRAEKNGLCYLRLRLTDEKGTTKVLAREQISVKVTGGELVGLGHACPYNEEGYLGNATSTYFGEALAIVRAGSGDHLEFAASCKSASSEISITLS